MRVIACLGEVRKRKVRDLWEAPPVEIYESGQVSGHRRPDRGLTHHPPPPAARLA